MRINRAIVLLILLANLSCKKENSISSSKQEQINYEVMGIAPRSTTVNTEYPASLQGQQEVEIRPMIDGYIEHIYVDEGATVSVGQPLFRVKAPQYEQKVIAAKADINIAQENVNTASLEVEKIRPLVEDEIISAYELKTAQNTLNSRKATLLQARARLVNAQTNLGYTIVTSPVDGIIGLLPYKMGSLVGPTIPAPLTTIANVGNIYAYFSLNEKQLLELNRSYKGATLQERLKQLPEAKLVLADGSVFPEKGKITTASGLLQKQTGAVSLRATFANRGRIASSGASATISLPEELSDAIIIPQSATYEIQDKKFVYTLTEANTAKSTEIIIRSAVGGQYYVVEKGLQKNDLIILGGIATLKDGAKVNYKKVNADDVLKIER